MTQKSKQLTWRKKLVFSSVTALLFFSAVEGSLAVVGVKPTTDTKDPYLGFSSQLPLMETTIDPQGNEIVSTAKNKRTWFNDQSFPRRKAKGTRRVFCLGGSTTYGHPYWDSTSFSRWLREYLPVADPSHPWEVINAGGISYASYRVARVLEELTQYEPDLFIVYSVHNEFLERRTYAGMFAQSETRMRLQGLLSQTRTWAALERLVRSPAAPLPSKSFSSVDLLPAEVDEMLNHTAGPVDYHRDPDWHAGVLKHYQLNLSRMVTLARNSGAQIILVNPTANEKDCSPFKSEPSSTLTAEDRTRIASMLERANVLAAADDVAGSLQACLEARSLDPHDADLQYRIGQLHWRSGDTVNAQQAFVAALHEDVCPLRAPLGISQTVMRVAAQMQVPVVDFEGRLRAKSRAEYGHTVFGNEYFLDHVHPTVEIQRHMALWIIDVLREQEILVGEDLATEAMRLKIDTITTRVLSEIDGPAQGVALRNLAKVLHWAGKFAEAASSARQALAKITDDPESRYVLADCLYRMGNNNGAMDEYQRLFERDVSFPRAHFRYGLVLAAEGKFLEARPYLIFAAVIDPQNAGVHYSLGQVHWLLQEMDFALESLSIANRLMPNDPETLYLLARATAENGDLHKALPLFRSVIDLGVTDPAIFIQYGQWLVVDGQMHAAIEQFKAALQLNPAHREAQLNLDAANQMRAENPSRLLPK